MKLFDDLIRRIEATLGITMPAPLRHPFLVIWTLVQDLIRCDLMKQASAMAYVTLLSLIPSLVAIFCVLSLFSPLVGKGSSLIDDLRGFILRNLATGSGESAINYINNMLENLDLASMGWASFGSVLVTLILLLRQIEEALNRIWLIRKGRNVFTRFMYFWTFMTLGVLVLGIALGLSGGLDVRKWLSPGAASVGTNLPGWVVGISGGFLFFLALYKIVPNCNVKWRHAAAGALVSAICLQQGARLYAIYVKTANYQTLYGALAQLPLFLMWLYICWVIILLGALISWRMQEGFPREEKDDTLDAVKTPLEQFRNVQVKAMMPLITLVTIYKNFQQGTGRGISGQDLAHAMKIPVNWVGDALETLSSLGYIIASKLPDETTDGPTVMDPYFPAYPADHLSLWRMQADLARPIDEWIRDWPHDLPIDLGKALAVFNSQELKKRPEATLADALALVPARA